MNSKLFTFIAFFLLFTVVFSSCKKTESEPNYPVKISYEEFSLEGTGCQWTNLPYAHKVIVINSSEELEKYMSCGKDILPKIDFSKNTLLLASGKSYCGILESVVTDLKQHSSNKFSLDIEITLSDTSINKSWFKALFVKKMKEDCKVKLNEICKEQEIDYPVDVPFLYYSLEGTSCKWIRYISSSPKKTYTIINDKISRYYLACEEGCSYPEIDFSKYSLILAYGIACKGLCQTDFINLQKIDEQGYVMTVHLKRTAQTGLGTWAAPILVRKIGDYIPIELIVEIDSNSMLKSYPIKKSIQKQTTEISIF